MLLTKFETFLPASDKPPNHYASPGRFSVAAASHTRELASGLVTIRTKTSPKTPMTPKSRTSKSPQSKPYVEIPRTSHSVALNLVDLFAGIGGFHYGIEASAALYNASVRPILVSEIEETCKEVYVENHRCPDAMHGDINRIDLKKYVNDSADFLTAGFPCQPFSNSGLKLGLSDPRGQFYETIEKFILRFEAKVFILENVPGITKNGTGRVPAIFSASPNALVGSTMHTLELAMRRELSKKYDIKWLEFDSSLLGSPQVRKRVYIVGVRNDLGVVPDLGRLMDGGAKNSFMSIQERLTESERLSLSLNPNQERNIRDSMQARRPSFKDGMRRVGNAYTCEGGNVGQAYHAHGLVPTLTKVWARFLPIYFPGEGEGAPSDIEERNFEPDRFYGFGTLRRASIREVMRLKGFPEDFQPHSTLRFAYEHAGNAVNALVIREIANLLMPLVRQLISK